MRDDTGMEISEKSPEITADRIDVKPESIFSKKNIIIAVIILIGALFWIFRNYFIVATVNGQPISRWELTSRLMQQYGPQTLDQIINERLILAATRQKGIFINSSDIDTKVDQIKKNLAGKTTLDEALKMQGMDYPLLRRQLEIQISIEKMFGNEATVSSKEIDDFLAKNKTLYKDATDPAGIRKEITDNLHQQKLNDLFEKWFEQVNKDAKISKSL